MRWLKILRTAWANKADILRALWLYILDNTYYWARPTPSKELYELRYRTCRTCPHRARWSTKCALIVGECCDVCGCNLRLKLRLPDATCPLNKW